MGSNIPLLPCNLMIFRPLPWDAYNIRKITCGCYIGLSQAIISLKLTTTVFPWNGWVTAVIILVTFLITHPMPLLSPTSQPGHDPATGMDLVTTPSGLFSHALAEWHSKG
ncbi:hypothetical protein NXS19_004116 [Fusarium pseudograminearum]|nr:hypothetical protein NXS19_004116 [Fusarium pseudograminearum]